MNNKTFRKASLATLLAAASCAALAQTTPAGNHDQVVVPQVDRRDIEKPKFPSNDFEVGLFTGTYCDPELRLELGLRRAHRLSHHRGLLRRGRVRPDQGQRRAVPADPAGRHLRLRTRKSSPTTTCRSATTCSPARSSSAAGEPGRPSSTSSPASAAPSSTIRRSRPSTSASATASTSPTGSRCSSTCATTSSRSTCSASARTRRTSSSPAA